MYDAFDCNPSRSNSEYILYISNTAKVCINQQSINESGVKQKILPSPTGPGPVGIQISLVLTDFLPIRKFLNIFLYSSK